MDEKRGLLDLIISRLPLKSPEKTRLCEKFSAEAELSALKPPELLEAAGIERYFDFAGCVNMLDNAKKEAERDFAIMKARKMSYISIAEAGYPPLLREIFDPPALLYYIGRFPAPAEAENQKTPLAAVVGTRKAGGKTLAWTYNFCRALGELGISVVSGLAIGVDGAAHKGNLEGGGMTCAVLGSACDELHPASNAPLASKIVASGGAIISEYPPGTPAYKWQFPARNRIISGLCESVLVVEAGVKSGALITADFALEQGRDLLVAGRRGADGKLEVFGEGCRKLMEDGAPVVEDAAGLLAARGLPPPAPPLTNPA